MSPAGPILPPEPAGSAVPPEPAGSGLVRASWAGTAVFAATAVAAVASSGAARAVGVAVALALFVLGVVAFVVAYAVAVGRSRTEELSVAGVFLLSGSASASRRRSLLGSLGVEVVVALATAAARPFTSLAFGVLAPLYGLGLAGLWGARHGRFGPRRRPAARPARVASGTASPAPGNPARREGKAPSEPARRRRGTRNEPQDRRPRRGAGGGEGRNGTLPP